MSPPTANREQGSQISRLTSLDLMFFHLESRDWPSHFAGLAVVDGSALLDGSGRLRLDEIRDRVNRRLAAAPQLRRRLHRPGLLSGRAIWVDDARFDLVHHVHEAAVQEPGGDLELLDTAGRLYGTLLNRDRPLWELWFLTGLTDGRVGVLLKLHHSLADGMAALTLMGVLLDRGPDTPDPLAGPWAPRPIPGRWSLVADNARTTFQAVSRVGSILAHPRRLASDAAVGIGVAREAFRSSGAPRSSLNRPVRSGRRIRVLRLDLGAMRRVARAHKARINDVVLDLWSGGLRELMGYRGESTAGVDLIANLPVSLRSARSARTIDNQLGFLALPLPVWEPDVEKRLDLIARITREAKSEQRPEAMATFLAAASAMPFCRALVARQHSVNVKVTYVPGPRVPVYLLGARVLDILPIARLFGNVGLTLGAFSYGGQISLVVTADATAFPDLDVLMAGMEREWSALSGARIDAAVPA